MRFSKLTILTQIGMALLIAQTPPSTDGGWPREIDTDSIHLVIYQPQVDSWKDNRIEARSAVIVTRNGDPKQIFGTVSIHARTEIDKETRLVAFEDLTVKDARFPSDSSLEPSLLKALRQSVPAWPRTVSLDRLMADLAFAQAENKAESTGLKNDPPEIIFSKVPAVLVLLDGEPVFHPVEGTHYSRIVNTPALLLFDHADEQFYLDGGRWWMTAPVIGSWTAAEHPPVDLEQVKQQLTKDEEKDPASQPASAPAGNPPAVYVRTLPAELLITDGEPRYAPIPNTSLLYVTNSDNDIFMDTRTQQYYALLAGRWFCSKSLQGSWEWVPGEQVPRDFTRIPPGDPKAHVLASIPGTEQAREAVIANQIPQTAAVRRSEAKLEAHYNGDPEFRAISGTSMQYAVNTSSEVIRVDGRYYAVQHAIWFVADSPLGPWAVADMIPAEIYTIPPSCPLYHLRYVYVYGATPDLVYMGYTPGYMGAFVFDGAVVFGTGWWYPGILCGDFWCGWPWTWGLGFEFSYWGSGWFWRPVGHYWWYHTTPITHRIFYEHWNPHWVAPSESWVRANVNAYSHWGGNAIVARDLQQRGTAAGPGRGPNPDLYVGKSGQLYEHRSDGWYQRTDSGQWRRTPANPELEQERQSRSLGQSRQQEFENRGHAPGIPRTMTPPRIATPPRGRGK